MVKSTSCSSENLGLIPSTHLAAHNLVRIFIPKVPNTIFCAPWVPDKFMVHILAWRQNIYKSIFFKWKERKSLKVSRPRMFLLKTFPQLL